MTMMTFGVVGCVFLSLSYRFDVDSGTDKRTRRKESRFELSLAISKDVAKKSSLGSHGRSKKRNGESKSQKEWCNICHPPKETERKKRCTCSVESCRVVSWRLNLGGIQIKSKRLIRSTSATDGYLTSTSINLGMLKRRRIHFWMKSTGGRWLLWTPNMSCQGTQGFYFQNHGILQRQDNSNNEHDVYVHIHVRGR